VDVTEDEDECIIIEPLSTAVASKTASSLLPSSAAASRQQRCPECSMWLLGDHALRLHMDEHVAQKFQVLLRSTANICAVLTRFISEGV
jgi:hypothetical protein